MGLARYSLTHPHSLILTHSPSQSHPNGLSLTTSTLTVRNRNLVHLCTYARQTRPPVRHCAQNNSSRLKTGDRSRRINRSASHIKGVRQTPSARRLVRLTLGRPLPRSLVFFFFFAYLPNPSVSRPVLRRLVDPTVCVRSHSYPERRHSHTYIELTSQYTQPAYHARNV